MSSRESSGRSSRSPKKTAEDNTFLFVLGTVAVVLVGYAVYKNLIENKPPKDKDDTKENYGGNCPSCK